MSQWTKNPTEPGHYWWCDGKGGAVEPRHLVESPHYTEHGLRHCDNRGNLRQLDGYWHCIDVTKPAPPPYVEPTPPKVKLYRATINGELRWLLQVNDEGVCAFSSSGYAMHRSNSLEHAAHDVYTDIEFVKELS